MSGSDPIFYKSITLTTDVLFKKMFTFLSIPRFFDYSNSQETSNHSYDSPFATKEPAADEAVEEEAEVVGGGRVSGNRSVGGAGTSGTSGATGSGGSRKSEWDNTGR